MAISTKNSLYKELQVLVNQALGDKLSKLSEDEQVKLLSSDDFYKNLEKPFNLMAKDFLRSVNKEAPEGYREDEAARIDFEKNVAETYSQYFIELYGLLSVCVESIYHHRDYAYQERMFRNKAEWSQYSVLIRLHARAIRICNEAMSLMKAGYGTGALSRWRAIHELATTISYFVENPAAINLFLEHDKALSYEAMKDYNKYSELLRHEAYNNREIATARRVRDNLVRKYDERIKKPYGWLSVYSDGRLNNFRDLEQESGQEQLRPYYRYASYGIHANAKSLFSGEEFSVLERESILLTGASDGGMEEVMQLVPISICYATTAILVGINANHGSIIAANAIMLKQDQLASVFADMKLPDKKQ